jgi:hypothetical protein
MRLFIFIVALVVPLGVVTAQESVKPNRMQAFSAEDLIRLEATLIDASHAVESRLGRKDLMETSIHRFGLRHRSGPASAEQHADVTDLIIVRSGGAAIQIGGKIAAPRGTDGELRGDSIVGGQTYPARPGDMFNVPPHVAHQWIIKPGESISFLNIKFKGQPGS